MKEELFYSEEALLNRVLFLSDSNEINIFVEDEYKDHEYENIFNRLFAYQIEINKIFPMRGKPGVKKAFEEYGSWYGGKPAIYLVDGDFDIMLDKEMVEHPNYIYLNRYNIECYYVDKGATLRFMSGKMKKRQRDVINEINYDLWEYDTYPKLKKLFINYIIAQKIFPGEKNVGIAPYIYIDSQGFIDGGKIDEYANDLKARITNYNELWSLYNVKFETDLGGDASRLICGKYILASLARYLRKKTDVSFKEDDFRYYLVGEFDINKLKFVKERVIAILQQRN